MYRPEDEAWSYDLLALYNTPLGEWLLPEVALGKCLCNIHLYLGLPFTGPPLPHLQKKVMIFICSFPKLQSLWTITKPKPKPNQTKNYKQNQKPPTLFSEDFQPIKGRWKKNQNPNKTNGSTAQSTLGEWVSGPATQPAQPLWCQWWKEQHHQEKSEKIGEPVIRMYEYGLPFLPSHLLL